jgi:hypothetical protein
MLSCTQRVDNRALVNIRLGLHSTQSWLVLACQKHKSWRRRAPFNCCSLSQSSKFESYPWQRARYKCGPDGFLLSLAPRDSLFTIIESTQHNERVRFWLQWRVRVHGWKPRRRHGLGWRPLRLPHQWQWQRTESSPPGRWTTRYWPYWRAHSLLDIGHRLFATSHTFVYSFVP